MRAFGVTGRESTAVARAIGRRLAETGRVAYVGTGDAAPDGGTLLEGTDDATAVEVGESGVRYRGPPRSLPAVLDDLADDHDYAVVTGHADSGLPHVVVGEAAAEGEVLVRLDAADPSIEAAVEAVESVAPRETLASLVAQAKASPKADQAGAIATFTGRVREREDEGDRPTTHLEFETYEGVAAERMAEIAGELETREGVFEVVMHHKTGVVEAGEDIVFVVVLAGHREEAFATVSDGIDRLKAEVPIFKKEVTVDGEFWAHERD